MKRARLARVLALTSYVTAAAVEEDEYGRETAVSALARFIPRRGYEQDREAYQ